jgi:hypothetical protein
MQARTPEATLMQGLTRAKEGQPHKTTCKRPVTFVFYPSVSGPGVGQDNRIWNLRAIDPEAREPAL